MKTPTRPGRELLRNKFVTWLAAIALGVAPAAVGRAAGTEGGGYEVIANAFGFGVDIPGCPDASRNIREIAIDELNIDVREMTTGLDVEYRVLGPGMPHFGSAYLTVGAEHSKELKAWFDEAAKGKNIRKNIEVRLYKSDKTPGRSYSLFDCFPTQWSTAAAGADGSGPTETLRVRIGRIEFKTQAAPPTPGGGPRKSPGMTQGTSADPAPVRGFKVEISGSSGKEVDNAWESVSGGDMVIELGPTPAPNGGTDRFKTNSPGHKTVAEITLRGAMTDGRAALCEWINDTVQGKPWKQMLTVTELLAAVDGSVKPGKQFIYHECFPIRYVFPRMSVTNTTGNTKEEVVFQAVRDEPALPRDPLGVITIPGAPKASSLAVAAGIEDMAMDLNRVKLTGDARNHSAVLLFPRGGADELAPWFKEYAGGKGTPKTIRIDLYDRSRPTGTQVILHACVPVASVTNPTGNTMEEVTVKPIRVELK